MAYPLPIAQDPEIKRVQEYYARHHGITVPYDEAKRLLEGVMQFVYLTQIEDKLKDLKAELADSQNEELSIDFFLPSAIPRDTVRAICQYSPKKGMRIMPLVQIRYRRETLNDAEMESLVDELPEIVADSLRCADTGGNITPEEVEIWVSEYGRFDRNGKSLAIVISTDRLPTLVAEKQPRVESIEAGVYMLGLPIDEKDGYVELVLADSAIAYLED